MASIKFFIQSNQNPCGIYVRLRDGRSIDAKSKTNFIINPIDWSKSKGQHKGKDAQAKKMNNELSLLKSNLLSHFNNCVNKKIIDTKWLKEFINPFHNEDEIPTKLVQYFDYYILNKKNNITIASQNKLTSIKNLIDRFQKKTKVEYLIKDVNADFKVKFEEFCAGESYAKNTIAKTIRFVKTICYHARNNGIETHFQLNSIVGKYEKVVKIYLTTEELEKIQKTEIKTEYLDNARDWLIISCETGQRISDFLNFTKDKIRIESEVPLIEFTQKKTNKKMSIPLSPKVRAILDKRNGEFPRKISDQRYNDYIKDVCSQAGLTYPISGSKINKKTNRKETGLFPKNELVTSHIGRRTLATVNYGRIPTPYLMYMTGHTTEVQFLEYIGKTPTETAKEIIKYFK